MYLPAANGKESGFTLIEFVVASLILTVGVLGLLRYVELSVSTNAGNKMRSNAVLIADQVVGEERVKPFDSISTSKAFTPKAGLLGSSFVNYSISKTVTAMGSASKQVQVTIAWREKRFRKTHTLSTILTNGQTL